jgi:flavin-binding protein dodecin
VDVQVRALVTDDNQIDVLRAFALTERPRDPGDCPADRGRLLVGQLAEAEDVTPRLHEQMAEVGLRISLGVVGVACIDELVLMNGPARRELVAAVPRAAEAVRLRPGRHGYRFSGKRTWEAEMANVAKVITIIGSSPESFAKAADAAVQEASKTVRGITGADVVSMSALVEGERITEYRTTVNIAFAIER